MRWCSETCRCADAFVCRPNSEHDLSVANTPANPDAVLGAVKAASLRSAGAVRAASGRDRACAQRSSRTCVLAACLPEKSSAIA